MDETTLAALREELAQDRAQQIDLLEEHGADPYGEEVKDLRVGNDGFADAAQATEERSEALGHIEARGIVSTGSTKRSPAWTTGPTGRASRVARASRLPASKRARSRSVAWLAPRRWSDPLALADRPPANAAGGRPEPTSS
jgi:hypothetical protein